MITWMCWTTVRSDNTPTDTTEREASGERGEGQRAVRVRRERARARGSAPTTTSVESARTESVHGGRKPDGAALCAVRSLGSKVEIFSTKTLYSVHTVTVRTSRLKTVGSQWRFCSQVE